MAVFFVERNAANHRHLRRMRHEYDVEGFVESGNFWDKVSTITEVVGDEPAFLFVDPFGLRDLQFVALASLCNALKRVDVMVNFASPAARRLAPQQSALVDRAVGGPGWDVANVGDTFANRLQAACRFMTPARLPVSGTIGDLKYELIMAARHPAAYELWNDEIAEEDRAILDSGGDQAVATRVAEARLILDQVASGRTSFTRRDILRAAKTDHCGDVHHRVYLRAVNELVETGRWERPPGPIDAVRMGRRL